MLLRLDCILMVFEVGEVSLFFCSSQLACPCLLLLLSDGGTSCYDCHLSASTWKKREGKEENKHQS